VGYVTSAAEKTRHVYHPIMGPAVGPDNAAIFAQYHVTGRNAELLREVLEALSDVPPVSGAMNAPDAEQMRRIAGRAIESGFFGASQHGKSLLFCVAELESRGRGVQCVYKELSRRLRGQGSDPQMRYDMICATREAMHRLRDALDRFAAQAIEEPQVIEIPKVRVGRRGIHRPRVVPHLVFSDVSAQSNVFAPAVAVATPGFLISCSAIAIGTDITLLLSAWPELWREDRTAQENMRYDRIAVLWAVLGLSAPSLDLSSSASVWVHRDSSSGHLLLASDLAYLTCARGRMRMAPIQGERRSLLWNIAFHIKPAAVAGILPRVDFTPAEPEFVQLSDGPADVARIFILKQGGSGRGTYEPELVTDDELMNQLLVTTLQDSTVLLASASSVDLGWPETFLKDVHRPSPVYQLFLPRDRAEIDYTKAAEAITGRKRFKSDEDRLTDAIEGGHGAIVMVDSAPSALLAKRRFQQALQRAVGPILFSMLDPNGPHCASVKIEIENCLRILDQLGPPEPGGKMQCALRTARCTRPYFVLDDDTVLGKGPPVPVPHLFRDLFKLLGGAFPVESE